MKAKLKRKQKLNKNKKRVNCTDDHTSMRGGKDPPQSESCSMYADDCKDRKDRKNFSSEMKRKQKLNKNKKRVNWADDCKDCKKFSSEIQ